ncbi:UdgX family uracil-DNA binding protein [Verrucomicrobiota bacterium sgz303538]
MNQITFPPTFPGWQRVARRALHAGIPPEEIHWEELQSDQPSLALFEEAEAEPNADVPAFRVPRAFIAMARHVACHRDERRWALLYRVLWRLTHDEPQLLEIVTDPDTHELLRMDKAVRHDIHKMRAFVRFREVRQDGESWFVAWFEPEHHIVELNASFFVDRFASMHWSILTPDRCVHWDGNEVRFTEGVSRSEAPGEDAVEELWLKYYSHIFNPARLKTRAMQHEMPKKYWRNLPEAAVIPALIQEAPRRVENMIIESEAKDLGGLDWHPAKVPDTKDLKKLREVAAGCTACPLFKNATQTVFGEGPRNAEIVFLGEQPGDQEDRAGHPFVGPAGQLLNRALEEAGINRDKCYVTNVVKHFKWEPRGKRRLHQTPNARDVAACRPWMEAELSIIKPSILVCLGATAAKAIFGAAIRVTKDRGHWLESPWTAQTLITVHPSSLLRAPSEDARRAQYELFIADLRVVAEAA